MRSPVFLAAVGIVGNADDWPLVRGDAFGTGVAHDSLAMS